MSESPKLTHLDARGRPRMVDVSGKPDTRRTAVAEGRIRMAPATLAAIQEGAVAKGNVLRVAEVAGVMAGKRTGELIPLCHILPGAAIRMEVAADPTLPGVRARAVARIEGQTGVEMEALTAVQVALLTVYDMCKALDRAMTIDGVQLMEKSGGRSGRWVRP